VARLEAIHVGDWVKEASDTREEAEIDSMMKATDLHSKVPARKRSYDRVQQLVAEKPANHLSASPKHLVGAKA